MVAGVIGVKQQCDHRCDWKFFLWYGFVSQGTLRILYYKKEKSGNVSVLREVGRWEADG